ncbi:MAG: PQQ-binding-like beta-propeller repeat protein [Prolixibacteraceae bacterium]|nr:PQQ-binding-like beta-propeller repeat protein [Prolixibacteraceae bacterium]
MRILFTGVLLFVVVFLLGQTGSSWPNSRGNMQLHGTTTVSFPRQVQLKWTFDADGVFKSAPVIAEGKIVVGSTNGTLYCLSMKGDSIWGFKTGNSIEAPALIHQGVVYIGNLSGTLYALELTTGKQIWTYQTDNQIMGAPTLLRDGTREILAVGSYDYYLHGIDAKTGKKLWQYETENFLNSAPALWNGNAVFGGCDGFLHMVNLKTGISSGKVEVATYVASSPAVIANLAYIGDYDGGFTCIDLEKKNIKWRYTNPDNDLPFIASPSLVADKILIGSRDKFMYCFDRHSGKLLWKKNTGSRIDASTVANTQEVLLINMRGDIMVLNIENGVLVWNYQLGVGAINAPAVISNAIVIAGSNGNVYYLASPSHTRGGE